MGDRRRWRSIVAAAAAAVAVDQLTKWWALETLGDGRVIEVVGSLQLDIAYNPGGAFSIGRGSTGLFIVLGVAVLGGLLWWSRFATSPLAGTGLGLVLGGALGNLSDRLFRDLDGRVVDFIDLQWWPVFNMADVALFCGATLLLIATWRDDKREREELLGDARVAE